jgi:hypothetical protein
VDAGCRPGKVKTTQVTSEASVWDSRADKKVIETMLDFKHLRRRKFVICFIRIVLFSFMHQNS